MKTTLQLYRTSNGSCPYRKAGIWENISFYSEFLLDEFYEDLLNQGFRRSGFTVYHPACQDCNRCIPIRVDALHFTANKQQRRTFRKNQDLQIVHQPLYFDEAIFHLYQKYQCDWHGVSECPSQSEFESFLLSSPVTSEMILFYQETTLIAVSWIDRLPNLVSSVYFVFDPEFAARRLGVFSILYELAYCQRLGKPWLYLGFWVEDSPKMSYKSRIPSSRISN